MLLLLLNCSFIIDDYWLLLMIICYCNKANFSGSIYKVTRPVLNFFFFFTIKFYKHRKAQSIYCFFFQDKILSTLNTLVFVQDKMLYQI